MVEEQSVHKFVEVDFAEVTKKKTMLIATKEVLVSKLGPTKPEIDPGKGEIVSEHYSLLPCDLRDLKTLDDAFTKAQLDAKLPTLILAECVLIYLEPTVSRQVVKWCAEKFETAAFVTYEQIHPDDAFGQQMLRNLESRGCPLLGLHDTPTLESKERRFTDLGWQRALAMDMDAIYHQQLDPIDRGRIERLEIFDEFEEWNIMQAHYCVAYGVKDDTGVFENFGFSDRKGANIEKPAIPPMM
uniref:Leucine carboxyl methyltransferase 1 homolog n=1 Tax=Physcomitrium patens TaxID=3218 RepID=A0A7I4DZ98_PHYPA